MTALPSRRHLASRDRLRPTAFSFIEIMFAVMVLGIGFIMVAALFPVAMRQTRSTVEESTGRTLALNGLHYVDALATSANVPATGTDPDPAKAPLRVLPDGIWNQVRANAIDSADPRYAWTVLYSRAAGASTATFCALALQARPGEVFRASVDLGAVTAPVQVTLTEGYDQPDTITFASGSDHVEEGMLVRLQTAVVDPWSGPVTDFILGVKKSSTVFELQNTQTEYVIRDAGPDHIWDNADDTEYVVNDATSYLADPTQYRVQTNQWPLRLKSGADGLYGTADDITEAATGVAGTVTLAQASLQPQPAWVQLQYSSPDPNQLILPFVNDGTGNDRNWYARAALDQGSFVLITNSQDVGPANGRVFRLAGRRTDLSDAAKDVWELVPDVQYTMAGATEDINAATTEPNAVVVGRSLKQPNAGYDPASNPFEGPTRDIAVVSFTRKLP